MEREQVAGSAVMQALEEIGLGQMETGKKSKGKGQKRKKASKRQFTAASADKYELYQLSVQDAEFEVDFLSKTFRKLRGRDATKLREDFCGTCLVASAWVASDSERTATGVDLDPEPLRWGMERNILPLGDAAKRVTQLQENVLAVKQGKFDIAVGFNFSYWIFEQRAVMLDYFRAVKASLASDGMFFLDAYGGWDAQQEMEEPRKVAAGFTYVWDQHSFNPIDSTAVNHIHFRFRDGTSIKRAFTYKWRLWSLIEIREMLEEVGFSDVRVYWEDEDEAGEGTGNYRSRKKARNDPGWLAYVVAAV